MGMEKEPVSNLQHRKELLHLISKELGRLLLTVPFHTFPAGARLNVYVFAGCSTCHLRVLHSEDLRYYYHT